MMRIGRLTFTQRLATRGHDWREDARCNGLPPDWFDAGTPSHNMRALAYCDVCPVRRRCRDWMLDTPGCWAPAGIIGGGWVWGKFGAVLRVHPDDLIELAIIREAARARARAARPAQHSRPRVMVP